MISKITVGTQETTFEYDADISRVMKTQGSDRTLYFGPDFEIINGKSTLYVFAGNLRVAKLTEVIGYPSIVEYYHKDHLGSTTVMSEEDGSYIDAGEYMPYGLDRSDNALLQYSAYKFTDQEQDYETGLYNYDARMYDPVIGQFVMADTIVPDPFNLQSLNRYAYCQNNPLKYVDPSGHWIDPDTSTDSGLPISGISINNQNTFDLVEKNPTSPNYGLFSNNINSHLERSGSIFREKNPYRMLKEKYFSLIDEKTDFVSVKTKVTEDKIFGDVYDAEVYLVSKDIKVNENIKVNLSKNKISGKIAPVLGGVPLGGVNYSLVSADLQLNIDVNDLHVNVNGTFSLGNFGFKGSFKGFEMGTGLFGYGIGFNCNY